MFKTMSMPLASLVLMLFFLNACQNKENEQIEPIQSEAMKAFEIGSYNIVQKNGKVITYQTQEEVLNHFEGTDRYAIMKGKFDFLNAERKTILELGLIEKSEDDPAVINYLKSFEHTDLRTGVTNFCFHDENRKGKRVWTPRTNPVIKAANRNKYSSITAISPQTLCNNKWYGGNHYFYWGTYDKLQGGNDNNAESYY